MRSALNGVIVGLNLGLLSAAAPAADPHLPSIVTPRESGDDWKLAAFSTEFGPMAFGTVQFAASEGEEESDPGHIRDNAFLVEEAFNQEPGEVQHVFNWIHLWNHDASGRTRDFANTYTMELPLGSQAHQFSLTTLLLSAFEDPAAGPSEHQGGVGDTFLSYRYQLLADDDFLWCAPRLSLIVPTGDERFGLGTGEVGYQFNLPISRYGDQVDFHFNAGYTFVPNVAARSPAGALLGVEHDLHGYNLGASAFWKPRVDLHWFVEMLALWFHEIDDVGDRQDVTQVFLNPGVRYAVCQFEQVEWVLGASVPVGLTSETPDIGMFAYMSIEHTFLKVNK